MELQPSISTVVQEQRKQIDEQATAAEILFTKFLVKHNLPVLVANHFSKLTKVMFSYSKMSDAYTY